MALPFFAFTLFVSAFLLFLVQPMIGKLILPKLGGTPQVWNTCMVFFQTALLAGYAYTHTVSTRLKLRTQLMVHSGLLLLPLLLFGYSYITYRPQPADREQVVQGDLAPDPESEEETPRAWAPFYSPIRGPESNWNPLSGGNPIFGTLWLLTIVVGVPFFVVATSAPLLQKWFGATGHPAAKDPYFLYGASNLGSFLSLLAYPFVIEPWLYLNTQGWTWAYGYGLLVLLFFGCVGLIWAAPASARQPDLTPRPRPEPRPEPEPPRAEETGVKAGTPPGAKTTSFKKSAKQKGKAARGPGARGPGAKGPAAAPSPALKSPARREPLAAPTAEDDSRLGAVTPARRLRWVALAAVPSSLMLGVTTYATTDLSPIPLLWLIPLMLYLVSFILVFMRWPVVWTGTPHRMFVWAQPFVIAALILVIALTGYTNWYYLIPIVVHIVAFWVTTMVCHGELAKDRPGTESLTEFYLLMSVGGMLGGMFNALIAPVLFVYVIEYPLAIFVGALLRPQMFRTDWLDDYFVRTFGSPGADPAEARKLGYSMDVGAAVVVLLVAAVLTVAGQPLLVNMKADPDTRARQMMLFRFLAVGVPLAMSIALMNRPLRYGLAIGAILLTLDVYDWQQDSSVYSDRSYFGVLRVKETGDEVDGAQYRTLIHGHINHGRNYLKPGVGGQPGGYKDWGNPEKDFSRLPTTYYHRFGPAGIVMENYNWFPDLGQPAPGLSRGRNIHNTFWADARMPASLAAIGAAGVGGLGTIPDGQICDLWSEPPYATIGLGTGTMADYARPFQHMHYYEIDSKILRLSVPKTKTAAEYEDEPVYLSDEQFREYMTTPNHTYFTALADAKHRGAEVWVLMGDARLRMAQPYREDPGEAEDDRHNDYHIKVIDGKTGGGPRHFYHMIVVDAFSSDAIPVHLLTKEAVEMYFDKLTEDGILCVHTSNRYVDLVPVVADIAKSISVDPDDPSAKLAAMRGHDSAPKNLDGTPDRGHFTSEWVMVARKPEYLVTRRGNDTRVPLEAPPDYGARLEAEYAQKRYQMPDETYWSIARPSPRPPWTDDYSNLIAVLR